MADTKEDKPEPNVSLVIFGFDDEPVAAYDLVAPPGSAVVLNGFQGSRVYEISQQDVNLQVKMVGVVSSDKGALPKKEEEPEPEPEPAATTSTSKSTTSTKS